MDCVCVCTCCSQRTPVVSWSLPPTWWLRNLSCSVLPPVLCTPSWPASKLLADSLLSAFQLTLGVLTAGKKGSPQQGSPGLNSGWLPSVCSNSFVLWAMFPAPTGVLTGRRYQGTSIHPGESREDTEGRWPHASSRKRTHKNCLSLRSPSFYSSENTCLSHLVDVISL